MPDSPAGAPPPPTSTQAVPRPPGAAVPRRPRPPKQRGTDFEPVKSKTQLRRRSLVWASIAAVGASLAGCSTYFFFPRTLFQPKTTFSVGYPADYAFGVDSRWQSQRRIWVCRDAEKLYVIFANCTHLGCTPDWVDSANKFKCPCHGSGYDSAGVNFEGPAPRPMDRCEVWLSPDGQLMVNKDKLFLWTDWDDPRSYVPA